MGEILGAALVIFAGIIIVGKGIERRLAQILERLGGPKPD